MDFKRESNELIIYLCERIDAENSAQVDQEINEIISSQESPFDVTLNALKLKYISSAGLRVILKVKKQFKNLKVVDVNKDVYDIFDMTGFTQMIEIKKAYRELSVDGCTIIGKGAKGTVYRYDNETIVKVYNESNLENISHERFLARYAFVLGVPTAISYDAVKVGDKYGAVFELLNASNLSTYIKEHEDNLDEYAKIMADVLKTVHEIIPEKKELQSAKVRYFKKTNDILADLDEDNKVKLTNLLNGIKDSDILIHGDYHTNNLMMQGNEPLLIDMDTLSYGNKVYDLVDTYTCHVGFGTVDKEMSESFLGFSTVLSRKFFELFFKKYLGKEDISKDLEKIRLLSFIRMYHHYKKRINEDPTHLNRLANIKEEIIRLLGIVEDLNLE